MKLRSWQIWALALAVMVRALVPVGYMLAPVEGDATFPRVVICTSAGMKIIEADGRPAGEHGGAPDLAPCAYAALARPSRWRKVIHNLCLVQRTLTEPFP